MAEKNAVPIDAPDVTHVIGPLPNEFEIEIGEGDEAWIGGNGAVIMSVIPGESRSPPSKLLNDRPALLWKANHLRNALTPQEYKDQWLIGELDGVFVHLKHDPVTGLVRVIVSKKRLV